MNSFLVLFDGWSKDHLQLSPGEKTETGKVRGEYRTVPGPITAEMVQRHFDGEVSLGVSPLREDGTVMFGAIDVDIADMDIDLIHACARRIRATCAFFWSKSRGIHIYVFAEEPIPAQLMVDYLTMLRNRLPKEVQVAAKEIFPKQTSPTDVKKPSAINLPMFGKQRECIGGFTPDGRTIAVGDNEKPTELFDLLATDCRVSLDFVTKALKARQVVVDTVNAGYRIPDDPPGRQELLWRVACSMQARGWPDQDLEAELRRLKVPRQVKKMVGRPCPPPLHGMEKTKSSLIVRPPAMCKNIERPKQPPRHVAFHFVSWTTTARLSPHGRESNLN